MLQQQTTLLGASFPTAAVAGVAVGTAVGAVDVADTFVVLVAR